MTLFFKVCQNIIQFLFIFRNPFKFIALELITSGIIHGTCVSIKIHQKRRKADSFDNSYRKILYTHLSNVTQFLIEFFKIFPAKFLNSGLEWTIKLSFLMEKMVPIFLKQNCTFYRFVTRLRPSEPTHRRIWQITDDP